MRLRELVTGDLTYRELINYIRYLPRESALARELLGEAADYTPEVARLDQAVYLLAGANWQRSGKQTGAPKPPKPPRIPHTDI